MACLTKEQFDILQAYIRARADDLGLKDWQIILADDPAEADYDAQFLWSDGSKYGKIKVKAEFAEMRPERQREAIIHELIHAHWVPAEDIIRLDLMETGCVPKTVYEAIYRPFVRAGEYAVDGLAVAIAPSFPLIDWEKPDAALNTESGDGP